MNDRELLEAAARAAGVEATACWNPESNTWTMWTDDDEGRWLAEWNPLTADADAFRLAVDLGIHLYFEGSGESEAVWANEVMIWIDGQDKHAETRRAITRAAAALSDQR